MLLYLSLSIYTNSTLNYNHVIQLPQCSLQLTLCCSNSGTGHAACSTLTSMIQGRESIALSTSHHTARPHQTEFYTNYQLHPLPFLGHTNPLKYTTPTLHHTVLSIWARLKIPLQLLGKSVQLSHLLFELYSCIQQHLCKPVPKGQTVKVTHFN